MLPLQILFFVLWNEHVNHLHPWQWLKRVPYDTFENNNFNRMKWEYRSVTHVRVIRYESYATIVKKNKNLSYEKQ